MSCLWVAVIQLLFSFDHLQCLQSDLQFAYHSVVVTSTVCTWVAFGLLHSVSKYVIYCNVINLIFGYIVRALPRP